MRPSRGWLALEVLLATALCVALTSAGVITMYQMMGMNKGLYPQSQIEQVELSRLLLEIERDFYNADRAYVWNSNIQEKVSGVWGPLQSGTHNVSVTSGVDLETWPVAISPSDDAGFLANWLAKSPTTIQSVASDNVTTKYYTLVFLKGFTSINAVVYLACTYNATTGVTYTLTRYENDGTKLWQGSQFTYNAPGATFTTSDQSATGTTFPSFTRDPARNGVIVRFPTAFSTALRDIGTGAQARRVKTTADAWGLWTFIPCNATRWD